MNDIKVEGVSWNADSLQKQIAGGLTERQFVDRSLDAHYYRQFARAERVRLLKMVYHLAKKGSGLV